MAATMTVSALNRAFLASPVPARVSQRRPLRVTAATKSDPAAPSKEVVDEDVLSYAKTMPGICAPFPNIFDPANLLNNAGASNKAIRDLRRWRESEVTHGRVAMLATLGFLAQEAIEDYGVGPFPHVQGPAIVHFQQVEAKGAIFWTPLVFAIALAESYRVGKGWENPSSENFFALRDDYEPGNLGFDPLGLLPTDPKERYDMQTKELNNGRLAMIAIAGFVAQELKEKSEVLQQTQNLFGGAADKAISSPNA